MNEVVDHGMSHAAGTGFGSLGGTIQCVKDAAWIVDRAAVLNSHQEPSWWDGMSLFVDVGECFDQEAACLMTGWQTESVKEVPECACDGEDAVYALGGDFNAHGKLDSAHSTVEEEVVHDAFTETAFGAMVVSGGVVNSGVLSLNDPRITLSLDKRWGREETEEKSCVVVTSGPAAAPHNRRWDHECVTGASCEECVDDAFAVTTNDVGCGDVGWNIDGEMYITIMSGLAIDYSGEAGGTGVLTSTGIDEMVARENDYWKYSAILCGGCDAEDPQRVSMILL